MAFQYAAKFICGVSKKSTPVANGQYVTVINIHSPNKEAKYRYKLALAGPGKDGKILDFNDARIEADGAHYFDCALVRKIYGMAAGVFIDGFFVVESDDESLDVIAVFTTNNAAGTGVPAIDVENVAERKI
jgi:hypothetical protein